MNALSQRNSKTICKLLVVEFLRQKAYTSSFQKVLILLSSTVRVPVFPHACQKMHFKTLYMLTDFFKVYMN